MTAARTRSEIGRSSRRKGAAYERAVANALRPWYPDVHRSRDNGSTTTADTGDLAGTHERLWWSLKNVAAACTEPPALIGGWLDEARAKAADRIPLVVTKRHGHSDPLSSWCWLSYGDAVAVGGGDTYVRPDVPVRMQLRHVLDLLAGAGLAQCPNREET